MTLNFLINIFIALKLYNLSINMEIFTRLLLKEVLDAQTLNKNIFLCYPKLTLCMQMFVFKFKCVSLTQKTE